MKKYIILGVLFVFLAAAAVVLWLQLNASEGNTPIVRGLSHKVESDTVALSMVESKDLKSVWFSDREGKIYRTQNGVVTEYPSAAYADRPLEKIIWNRTGGDFLAVGTRSNAKAISYFDSVKQVYVSLPANVGAIDWLTDGRVAMIWKSGDGKSQQLVVANPDATGYKIVTPLPWPDFEIRVAPTGNKALLLRNSPKPNKIYLFNLEDGKYEALAESERIINIRWIDSTRFIYDAFGEDSKSTIRLFDTESRTEKNLNLATTVEKVAWNSLHQEFLAAVPLAGTSGDKIVKLPLNGTELQDYYTGLNGIRAIQVLYSNGILYLINAQDGKIYSVK
jgi:hypothetical protein